MGDTFNELEGNLGDLSKQCGSFKEHVTHFINAHKRNRKTLNYHMQLLDLLEVPQLVDACARNGFHDEALELANFINALERRHLLASEVKSSGALTSKNSTDSSSSSGGSSSSGSSSISSGSGSSSSTNKATSSVVQSIVDDVHRTLAGLRQQLLHQVCRTLLLPPPSSSS